MKRVIFVCLVLCSICAQAQTFGGNPSYIEWRQINTKAARVIYPEGLDSIAQRIEAIVNYMHKNYSGTIGEKLRKINIVLQSNTSVTNGYVALAPYRSEFYLMPPQNAFELGAQNWADNLSIHEFRHVQQYSNFDNGLSKDLSLLFGEEGQDLGNAASIPNWFFEGDAVYNETTLSHQGRGRLPAFFAGYRSMFDLGKHYTYMQLRNGSLQHYIPDHYPLGYMLVAYGRDKYGEDFWRKVTADASAFHPLIYPFQNAVKKYSGVPFKQFVNNAFDFYQQQWKNDTLKDINWTTTTEKNNVVDYKYPYLMEDGSLLLLKGSYTKIPAFVIRHTDGTEQQVIVKDISHDDYFSYNNNMIVYSAYRADTRWGYRDYSIIKVVDIKKALAANQYANDITPEGMAAENENRRKATKTIDHRTKYLSPDISHDGKLIAAVHMQPGLRASIVLMTVDGKILKEWSNKNAVIYSYPKFSADDKFIYEIVRDNRGMMGMEKRNIANDSVRVVLNFRNRILGFPVVQGDTVLYSCSNDGYDEIWAYIDSQNADFRVARYATGLYQGIFNQNKELVSSAFTADGYRLGKFKTLWQVPTAADTLKDLYVKAPFKPFTNNTLQEISHTTYPVEKYPKTYHLVNIHSYRPFYDYPNTSVIVYGDNVLNTFETQLYYTHNHNEGYNKYGFTGVYGGTYVQPVLDVNQTYNRQASYRPDTVLRWNEFNISAGLQLPLDLSAGRQYRSLTLSSTFNYNHVNWRGLAKTFLNNAGLHYLQNRLEYVAQSQMAKKQIYPSFAQVLVVQYRSSVDSRTAHQLLFNGSFYLPGIAPTNSLVVSYAYQVRDNANQYYYTNDFPISRGYSEIDYPRMWKIGVNYHFPICYPDRGFGNIAYFLRVRANLFFDYSTGSGLTNGSTINLPSVGAELYIDGKIWNELPATLGFRYSKLLNGGGSMFELVAPVLILN
ncbi:MAG TPA: hypothetical protein VG738_03425 [Chitinophagaceae bacterium]|nr:hypothetical protein [Chitinophagaceae bacterium]